MILGGWLVVYTCLKACSRATERALEPATIPWEYWSPNRTIAGWMTVEGMLQQPKKSEPLSCRGTEKTSLLIICADFFLFVLPDLLCQGRFATVLMEMRKQTDFVTVIRAERDLKEGRWIRDEVHTFEVDTLTGTQTWSCTASICWHTTQTSNI